MDRDVCDRFPVSLTPLPLECAYCQNEIEGAPSLVQVRPGEWERWCADCAADVRECDCCGNATPRDRLDLVCVDEGGRDEPPTYEERCPHCIAADRDPEDDDDEAYDGYVDEVLAGERARPGWW